MSSKADSFHTARVFWILHFMKMKSLGEKEEIIYWYTCNVYVVLEQVGQISGADFFFKLKESVVGIE